MIHFAFNRVMFRFDMNRYACTSIMARVSEACNICIAKRKQLNFFIDMSCRSQYIVVSNSALTTFTWVLSKCGLNVYVLL